MDADPDGAGYRLAYEEARRGLDDQERAVEELRSRAGTLVAAAAIATSFFGTEALHRHVPTTAWIAIACFAALGVSVIAILWPRRDWKFALSPERFIGDYLEPDDPGEPLPLPAIHRDLALHMGASASQNRQQLHSLTIAFRLGALLLLGEVCAWIFALISQS